MDKPKRIIVWDSPLRGFHWLLAASYASAYLTSRSEWLLEYHTVAGITALGLTLFRILLGLGGTGYASFSSFVRGPGEALRYVASVARLRPGRYLGHNPAVGLMVVVMLTVTLLLTASGLLSYWGVEGRGAGSLFVGFDTGLFMRGFHEYIFYFAAALIAVHVSAALVHDLIFGEGLIVSMVTGRKDDDPRALDRIDGIDRSGLSRDADDRDGLLPSLASWAVLGSTVVILIAFPPHGSSTFQPAGVVDDGGRAAAVEPSPLWKAECAEACHGAIHPTLLPSGSWKGVMAGLDDHFGDFASLDAESEAEILEFLLAAPAERSVTEASRMILASVGEKAPLRVTETGYWKDKHGVVDTATFTSPPVYSKANCSACHPGAEEGSFEDEDIEIPEGESD